MKHNLWRPAAIYRGHELAKHVKTFGEIGSLLVSSGIADAPNLPIQEKALEQEPEVPIKVDKAEPKPIEPEEDVFAKCDVLISSNSAALRFKLPFAQVGEQFGLVEMSPVEPAEGDVICAIQHFDPDRHYMRSYGTVQPERVLHIQHPSGGEPWRIGPSRVTMADVDGVLWFRLAETPHEPIKRARNGSASIPINLDQITPPAPLPSGSLDERWTIARNAIYALVDETDGQLGIEDGKLYIDIRKRLT